MTLSKRSRRDFLKFVSAIGSSLLIGTQSCAQSITPSNYAQGEGLEQRLPALQNDLQRNLAELSTLKEFTYYYISNCLPQQKDPQQVNILYPGSGVDILSPLAIALPLLYTTQTKKATVVCTEIGDYERAPTFHDGFDDIHSKFRSTLEQVFQSSLTITETINPKEFEHWRVEGIPSHVVRWRVAIPGNEEKELDVVLAYNTIEWRPEPRHEDKEYFTEAFIQKVRSDDISYWPHKNTDRGDINSGYTALDGPTRYPKYARDEQFSEADIILSKMSGDWDLLQFDYLRAMLNSRDKRQRVVLTEHPRQLYVNEHPLTGYHHRIHTLKNNVFGYADGEKSDDVGMLILRPN